MHIQFQLVQQCIQISTRINSSSVHTYIFVCSTLRVILQGFVDPKCNRELVGWTCTLLGPVIPRGTEPLETGVPGMTMEIPSLEVGNPVKTFLTG